jgi:hypothetical protein
MGFVIPIQIALQKCGPAHQLRKRKLHESLRFAKREAAESSRLSGVDPPNLISRSVGT